jgi:hypothetical protein
MTDRLTQIKARWKDSVHASNPYQHVDDIAYLLSELTRAQAVIEAARELSDSGNMYEFSDAFVSKEGKALDAALAKYDEDAP